MIRRIGFVLAFALIIVPAIPAFILTVLLALICWFIRGGNQDRILMNPILMGLVDFPFKVLGEE